MALKYLLDFSTPLHTRTGHGVLERRALKQEITTQIKNAFNSPTPIGITVIAQNCR